MQFFTSICAFGGVRSNMKIVKPGVILGYLTVIDDSGERKRGAILWNCRCECGKYLKVKTDYLQQGWTKSCGCFRIARAKERIPEIWANNPKKNQSKLVYKLNILINGYKRGAAFRNLEFNLSK